MKTSTKQFALAGGKMPAGATITDEQLAAVNRWTLKALVAEDVYIRPLLLCHNGIDRDQERFSEPILQDFAATLPGKALLLGHTRREHGKGLFFAADVVNMSPAEYHQATGESINLPEGVTTVQTVKAWFYIPKTAAKEELLSDIDAGLARHVSIGFKATEILPVKKDDVNSSTLYYEYVAPGEATEGSLVWLGAQPGASVVAKAAGTEESDTITGGKPQGVNDRKEQAEQKIKEKQMSIKAIADAMGLSGDVSDSELAKAVRRQAERLKFLESLAATLGEEMTKEKANQLKAEAADGREFKKSLIARQVAAERVLKKLGDSPEIVEGREKQLASHYISEIEADVKFLEKERGDRSKSQFGDKSDGNENRDMAAPNTGEPTGSKFMAAPGTEVEVNG